MARGIEAFVRPFGTFCYQSLSLSMVMITLVLLHSAAASLMQDLQAGPSPYVLDYITKLNSDCTSAHCVDQLDSCSDGTDQS